MHSHLDSLELYNERLICIKQNHLSCFRSPFEESFLDCDSMCAWTQHIFNDPYPSVYAGVVNFILIFNRIYDLSTYLLILEPIFCQLRQICCTFELLRCLDVETVLSALLARQKNDTRDRNNGGHRPDFNQRLLVHCYLQCSYQVPTLESSHFTELPSTIPTHQHACTILWLYQVLLLMRTTDLIEIVNIIALSLCRRLQMQYAWGRALVACKALVTAWINLYITL